MAAAGWGAAVLATVDALSRSGREDCYLQGIWREAGASVGPMAVDPDVPVHVEAFGNQGNRDFPFCDMNCRVPRHRIHVGDEVSDDIWWQDEKLIPGTQPRHTVNHAAPPSVVVVVSPSPELILIIMPDLPLVNYSRCNFSNRRSTSFFSSGQLERVLSFAINSCASLRALWMRRVSINIIMPRSA